MIVTFLAAYALGFWSASAVMDYLQGRDESDYEQTHFA